MGRKKKSFQLGVSARVGSRPPAPAGRGHVTRKCNEIRKIDFQRPLIHSQRILVLTARSALRHFEPGPPPLPTQAPEGPRAPCLKVSSFRTRALRQNAWAQR